MLQVKARVVGLLHGLKGVLLLTGCCRLHMHQAHDLVFLGCTCGETFLDVRPALMRDESHEGWLRDQRKRFPRLRGRKR